MRADYAWLHFRRHLAGVKVDRSSQLIAPQGPYPNFIRPHAKAHGGRGGNGGGGRDALPTAAGAAQLLGCRRRDRRLKGRQLWWGCCRRRWPASGKVATANHSLLLMDVGDQSQIQSLLDTLLVGAYRLWRSVLRHSLNMGGEDDDGRQLESVEEVTGWLCLRQLVGV